MSGRDTVWSYRKCPEWGRGYAQVRFDNYSWDGRMRVYAVRRNPYVSWVNIQ